MSEIIMGGGIEEIYESPNGSEWIVAVAWDGAVSVLKVPNIHPSFFDNGRDAELLGLPFECEDIYRPHYFTFEVPE